MDAADLYIREHLGEMITVETLARHFHLSRSTLRRYFLEFFEMPVQRYVFQQRMTWARELVEQEGATIGAVATETGFMDTSSFTRAFTRYYGHPPSYFRKR